MASTGDLDNHYVVTRSIMVNADKATIYDLLHNLRAWQQWSPWDDLDSNLSRAYSGPEAGVGARYEWKGGRRVGQGSMTITDVVVNESIEVELRFIKPFKSQSHTRIALASGGIEGTKITWTMSGPQTTMSRIMGVFTSMDKMVGPDFERGLANLKAAAESSAGA